MKRLPVIYEIRRCYINGFYEEAQHLLDGFSGDLPEKERERISRLLQLKLNRKCAALEASSLIRKHSTLNVSGFKRKITFGIKTNFAQPAKTLQTISSIYAQCIDSDCFEIIVTGDNKAESLRLFPNLRFIDNTDNAANGRLGAMMNTICLNADHDTIVSMDDDIILLDGWWPRLNEFIEKNKIEERLNKSVFAFPIQNIDGSRFWDSVYNTSHSGSLLTNEFGKVSDTDQLYYITGGMCLLSKKVWSVCQWDSSKGFYQKEDVDFSARLKQLGISVEYINHAYVLHNDWRYWQEGSKVRKAKSFAELPRNPVYRNQGGRFSKYSALQEEPGIWPPPLSAGIKRLRNKYQGERCFIVGNGPSLRLIDLSLLKNEYTFGVNSIFLMTQETGFRPTFFVVEDKAVMQDNVEQINIYKDVIKILPSDYYNLIEEKENVFWFRMNHGFYQGSSPFHRTPRFSVDAEDCVYCGQTVTYINLQLAFYLGFSEVYLIGMDFHYVVPETTEINGSVYLSTGSDPNHFDARYFGSGKTWHNPRLDRVANSYKYANIVFNEFGRKIFNASIGGKLDIFERANLYEALGVRQVHPRCTKESFQANEYLKNHPQVQLQVLRGDFTALEYYNEFGIYHE